MTVAFPSPNFKAPQVALAPLSGVTDLPFRQQAVAWGAPYIVSEMIAGESLARARPDVLRRAARANGHAPFVIQLAGREPRWMEYGARLAEDAGADVIDINMGCPAKQVTNGYSGSALMRDPALALSLIEATVRATKRPVTLKMRLGWCEQTANAPDIARRAEEAGVRMIVVHGRTRRQFYKGPADWRAVRATVDAARVPVIVNGDIQSAAQARAALKASGAAGVMIGRAAQGRPWLVGAIARALADGEGEALPPPRAALGQSLLALYDHTLSFYGTALGLKVARKHLAAAIEAELTDMPALERRAARADICRLEDPHQVRTRLLNLFDAQKERLAA